MELIFIIAICQEKIANNLAEEELAPQEHVSQLEDKEERAAEASNIR